MLSNIDKDCHPMGAKSMHKLKGTNSFSPPFLISSSLNVVVRGGGDRRHPAEKIVVDNKRLMSLKSSTNRLMKVKEKSFPNHLK